MSRIMNDENEWDQIAVADTVEGPIESVDRRDNGDVQTLETGKAPGPSEVYAETIPSSGDVGITVLIEICQRILYGKGMPAGWANSVAIPISKGKGDIMNCGMYRGVRLHSHPHPEHILSPR